MFLIGATGVFWLQFGLAAMPYVDLAAGKQTFSIEEMLRKRHNAKAVDVLIQITLVFAISIFHLIHLISILHRKSRHALLRVYFEVTTSL